MLVFYFGALALEPVTVSGLRVPHVGAFTHVLEHSNAIARDDEIKPTEAHKTRATPPPCLPTLFPSLVVTARFILQWWLREGPRPHELHHGEARRRAEWPSADEPESEGRHRRAAAALQRSGGPDSGFGGKGMLPEWNRKKA